MFIVWYKLEHMKPKLKHEMEHTCMWNCMVYCSLRVSMDGVQSFSKPFFYIIERSNGALSCNLNFLTIFLELKGIICGLLGVDGSFVCWVECKMFAGYVWTDDWINISSNHKSLSSLPKLYQFIILNLANFQPKSTAPSHS